MTLKSSCVSPFDSTTPMVINGKSVVAKVDVGYAADESAAAYRIITRWGYPEGGQESTSRASSTTRGVAQALHRGRALAAPQDPRVPS